jgi:hypothetical protein
LDTTDDDDKPKMVASKANKRAMAYFVLAFKTMKLLRLITKAKTEAWPGGGAWKVKKALSEKYRPDDVLTVSELKKRLNDVSLKGNQDPSDMFKYSVAIEHVYIETKATLGSQDLSGAVFSAVPENYHSVLNITAEMKGEGLDIDDLENACGFKVVENREVMMIAMKWYCLPSLAHSTCAKVKVTRPQIVPRKITEANEVDEVVEVAEAVVAIKEKESSWALATSVPSLATRRETAGNLK